MIAISAYRQSAAALGLGLRARAVPASPSEPGSPKPDAAGQTPAVILSRASHRESTSLTLYGPTGMSVEGLFDAARRPAAEQDDLARRNRAAQDIDGKKAEADAEVDGLSRKVAEHTRKLAADHIRTLKEAARRAKLLGLLDPKGAADVAKAYSRKMAQSAREFGTANQALTNLEDRQLARLQPDQQTTVTRDLAVDVSRAELRTDQDGLRRVAIEAVVQAIGGLGDGPLLESDVAARSEAPAEAGPSAPSTEDQIEVSAVAVAVRETVSVTTVVDTTGMDQETAAILEGRLDRLEGDAEVIKDAIVTLRDLKTMIAVAAKEAAKRGLIDKDFRKAFKEMRAEFTDAIMAVAEAAMPVIKAGFSIEPDEGTSR